MRIAAVSLLLLAFAAPARAGTVRVQRLFSEESVTEVGDVTRVRFEAAPGERNDVRMRVGPGSVLVIDRGAPLSAGRRCRLLDRHRARCRFDPRRFFEPRYRADLGDRGDRFGILRGIALDGRVDGGSGPDRLRGGPARDLLDGGPGGDRIEGRGGRDFLSDGPGRDVVLGGAGRDLFASSDGRAVSDDRFDGGPGRDRLGFFLRTEPVVARLGGTGGARGEHDRLAGLEGLDGGYADDVLYGTPGDDALRGSRGDDVIHAGAGDDLISPGMGGHNRVFAGPGDDRVLPFGHRGSRTDVRCGRGRDVVKGDLGEYDFFFLRDDCEGIQYYDRPLRAHPLRRTATEVLLQVHCSWGGRRTAVTLVAAAGTVARGRRRGNGRDGSICPTRLKLTALGRALQRPTRVRVTYPDRDLPNVPVWGFVLRP